MSNDKWYIERWLAQFFPETWMQFLVGLGVLFTVFFLLRWASIVLVRGFISQLLSRLGKKHWKEVLLKRHVFNFISMAVPLFITATGLGLLPMQQQTSETIERLLLTVALFYVFRIINALLLVMQDLYDLRPQDHTQSIKGYLQLFRIVVGCMGAVVLIAVLVDKSPLLMISGLGALSAVLLLVFKDTLLSVVASTQLSTNDMLRLGDWIEMPQAGADGFVIDIALHTVKVQNWDKTVTTIPTYKLFSESYRNWRQMFESGGRRIKRSMRIDASTVHFLTDKEMDNLRRFRLLDSYLTEKKEDLKRTNLPLSAQSIDPVNERKLTNIGTFRAYANAYLKHKEGVHQDMMTMVRMMEPTAEGIPIEVYCFSNDTAWVNYETLQGDIFDHLIAVLPEMGLMLYQSPSGRDLSGVFNPQLATKLDVEQMQADA